MFKALKGVLTGFLPAIMVQLWQVRRALARCVCRDRLPFSDGALCLRARAFQTGAQPLALEPQNLQCPCTGLTGTWPLLLVPPPATLAPSLPPSQGLLMPRLVFWAAQSEGRHFSLSALDRRMGTIYL